MDELFEKLFRTYLQRHAITTIVTGKAVDVGDKSFTLQRQGQPDLLDVRLVAVAADIATQIKITPKEGSDVLVGIIENVRTEAVLLQTSEIESLLIQTGDLLFEMKNGKFTINKGSDGFGACIDDLIIQIQAIYAPKNTVAITAIQNRFKAFLHA